MTSTERPLIILAFDIERSGATSDYETIAIGAAVFSPNYVKLGSFCGSCYTKDVTRFEPR